MKYVIYGAGGHARELLFQLQTERPDSDVVAFIDDYHHGREMCGRPVVGFPDASRFAAGTEWIVAVGSVKGRRYVVARLRDAAIALSGFVSTRAIVAPSAAIGKGVQIFAGTVVSDGVEIADNVIVNFACVLSHDVAVGEGSTISPRVAVAGRVRIGSGVFVGVGATVMNGTPEQPIVIGDGATIGAGACVIRPVAPGETVVGVPARPIRRTH